MANFSVRGTSRRSFLRTGLLGGAGLLIAQSVKPRELRASTTLNLQVSMSSDDAFENLSGITNTTATNFSVLGDGFKCGFRFQNVTIHQGTTIISATFSCYVLSTSSPTGCKVQCEAADNSATFSSLVKFDISARSKTADFVNWGTFGTPPGWQSPPDIKACVQDVISRSGWASGNALSVITTDPAGGFTGSVDIEAYDGVPLEAATLSITY